VTIAQPTFQFNVGYARSNEKLVPKGRLNPGGRVTDHPSYNCALDCSCNSLPHALLLKRMTSEPHSDEWPAR